MANINLNNMMQDSMNKLYNSQMAQMQYAIKPMYIANRCDEAVKPNFEIKKPAVNPILLLEDV